MCGCDVGGVVNGVVNDVSEFEDKGEAVNPFCSVSAIFPLQLNCRKQLLTMGCI